MTTDGTVRDIDTLGVEDLTQYARDLHALRQHARIIARYLGSCGVPRGETNATLDSLVRAGVVDGYNDILDNVE